ncbi:MAG: hypothetical protein JWO57_1536, partial [Pseudonocardiales bacterium]|nr:hypothetical protein [Pseudonocardiales bacterium]
TKKMRFGKGEELPDVDVVVRTLVS